MLQVWGFLGESLKKAVILPEKSRELNLKVIATSCSTSTLVELFQGIFLFRLTICVSEVV